MPIDDHHAEKGFRDPWEGRQPAEEKARRHAGGFLRWQLDRLGRRATDPSPAELPVVEPDIARPRGGPGELRVTWVGHATLLLQLGGVNVLTDPVFSRRASPVQWVGPARLVPPGVALRDLPEIHAVVVSHDHFDHLDADTTRAIAARWPEAAWFTPLGYRAWLARRGVRRVAECDWWEVAVHATGTGSLRLQALPARHWTARSPFGSRRRLWSAWGLETPDGARVYFGGDSGYFEELAEVGERAGPFDAAALPIGAYEPEWFMRPMHMNPEEALRAYRDLRVRGPFIPIHWGTFRLSDEPPLAPPARLRAAWRAAGLRDADLWVLRHGETRARPVPVGAPPGSAEGLA